MYQLQILKIQGRSWVDIDQYLDSKNKLKI